VIGNPFVVSLSNHASCGSSQFVISELVIPANAGSAFQQPNGWSSMLLVAFLSVLEQLGKVKMDPSVRWDHIVLLFTRTHSQPSSAVARLYTHRFQLFSRVAFGVTCASLKLAIPPFVGAMVLSVPGCAGTHPAIAAQ
jgi:hypothetical protein